MIKIERADLQIISRHSNLSESTIDNILKEQVYSDTDSWFKFLRLLFISLGVSFTTAGIVFFFAYNWADLDKFIKLGLVEFIILAVLSVILFTKINIDIKHILLTGAAILVGVLFAVFGQIYQTGANAYDFFLSWMLFITLWVAVSHFAPLWLVYICLINTTLLLYSEQVAHGWSPVFVSTLLFGVNILFLSLSLWIRKSWSEFNPPTWFSNLLALAAVSCSTIGIWIGIFGEPNTSFIALIILAVILYVIGIMYGLKNRSTFYLSIISFSVILVIAALLIKISDNAGMFFIVSLFVVASVTMVIRTLQKLQKQWTLQ